MLEFSRQLLYRLVIQEPPYEDALKFLQFAYMGDSKGTCMAPSNTAFSLISLVEGEALFLPALERLWTLYTGAYPWSSTSPTPRVKRKGSS